MRCPPLERAMRCPPVERAMRRAALALVIVLCLAIGCKARPEGQGEAPQATPAPAAAVPVRAAAATLAALERRVDAPGHTAALIQQKVRAPFAGTLVSISVADGDRVRRGDVLGTVVSRDSEAALTGAREMEREAKTPAQEADARRALALAQGNLIRAALHAPTDGVVLSHAAAAGDRVTEDQEILTLAGADSLVFVADVPQSALSQIRPGQEASVELAGRPVAVAGRVHDVLPNANAADFTAPVRIDIPSSKAPLAVGLFGTAHVVVERKPQAVIVPDAAVLRDDVTGKARIALLENGRARWQEVVTGLRGPAGIEIVSPPIRPGQLVVVEGQVGLPDGAAVAMPGVTPP